MAESLDPCACCGFVYRGDLTTAVQVHHDQHPTCPEVLREEPLRVELQSRTQVLRKIKQNLGLSWCPHNPWF